MPNESTSIDDVLQRLGVIIDDARTRGSRVGYFAVLYRLVTRALIDATGGNRFEDPARMERLAAIFAGRYFDALAHYTAHQSTPLCWTEAFHAASDWRPIVVQHLLLGINAHINYDLAIAVVLTAPADELPSMRHDYDLFNDILAGLIDRIELALARIYPALHVVHALGGRTEEKILEFSMREARASAWRTAERLAVLDDAARAVELERTDRWIRALALKVLMPGWALTAALLVVRAQERGSVARIIDQLEAAPEVNAFLAQVRSGAALSR